MVRPLLPILLLCASSLSVAAQQHTGHHHSDSSSRMEKNLSQIKLATTVSFDKQGRLWRVTVKDGFVVVDASEDYGKSFGTPVQVNPTEENIGADGDSRPKIALASDGTIYVSYTQLLNKPYSGDIRFSRSLDRGKHFSDPITINDNRETISHRFDAMILDSRDQVHLIWLDKRDSSQAKAQGQSYAGSALYYSHSADRGASFTRNRKLMDHTCECCRIAFAIDQEGIPVAFWRHIYDNNERDHALVRLDGKDQPRRVTFERWSIEACPHHGPALSITSHGDWHLAWFNHVTNGSGLFYANSRDAGRNYSTPVALGSATAQPGHAAILALENSVYLVWKEFDGKQSLIRGMYSANRGTTWTSAITLAQTDDASDHPQLVNHNEKVFLSWNTRRSGYQLLPFEVK